jgi:hypothetical protein
MNADSVNSRGPLDFLLAKGPLSQIVLALVISTILYIVLLSLEAIYISYNNAISTKTVIQDLTVLSNSGAVTYNVNPVISPAPRNTIYLPLSDNEKTGAEYSYSCFLLLLPGGFNDPSVGLRHIFHKGSSTVFPLMSPGVFVHNETNTLRIYQSSTATWNNWTEVQNIPINKWLHLAIIARNNSVEIYINGNVASKINLRNAAIYQNYQPLITFSNYINNCTSTSYPSIPEGDNFNLLGTANCQLSRHYYFNYALSYTEIQSLMNMGPNSQTVVNKMDSPPYFLDNWWSGQNMLM